MPCFLYYCITELTRSRAENCAIERLTCPMLKTLLLQKRSSQVGGNNVWGKPPLKMDLVKVEEKHIPKPGVRRGNDNSLNNNDYKLLSMAERWQDFLKEPAEHWCFKERGAGCVFRFEENKGTTVCSINTRCQHKQLHWEEAVSERR